MFELALNLIDRNPHQTRLEFDPKALADLAASIQVQGVLQPIVVRPSPPRLGTEGHYALILGERRYRASKLAGKTTIPVIVKRVSEQQAAEMTLVENLQRQDLDCLEQAEAFRHLSNEFKLTQEADWKTRRRVTRAGIELPAPAVAAADGAGVAPEKRAELQPRAPVVVAIRQRADRKSSADRGHEEDVGSVAARHDLEHRHAAGSPDTPQQGAARWVDPNVKAAQRSLETVLGMRVRIRDRKGKGKITIEYGTLEDFDRVVGMLQGEKV